MDIINSIKFDGYKSFLAGNENEISLEPYVSVFIGKNNCGKSSCMDVLEAVFGGTQSNQLRKVFNNLSFSTPANELYIDSCFSSNIAGGEISGNHNSYVRKFMGKNIYLDFYTKAIRNNTMELKLSEVQPNLELPVGKNLWVNMVRYYQSIFDSYHFRRINADRDVVPEKETNEESLDSNGNGVTNLLRKFVKF